MSGISLAATCRDLQKMLTVQVAGDFREKSVCEREGGVRGLILKVTALVLWIDHTREWVGGWVSGWMGE